MSEDDLMALIRSMEMAAFRRRADGTFSALTPAPEWFPRLAADTFPFLGHILDEANVFWRHVTTGRQRWGPVAETDAEGREFHYLVSAVAARGRQFLVFQLDPASDRMREVLQAARERKLADGAEHRAQAAIADELRRAGTELQLAIGRLATTSPTPAQRELIDGLEKSCEALVAAARRLT